MTAWCILATLLPISGAQAADSILTGANSAHPTVAQHSPNQLIALRKKKRIKKRVKQKAKTTATAAPRTDAVTTSPTDLTQTTPPPAPPTPPAPPALPDVTPPPPVAPPVEAPKAPEPTPPAATTPAPNQFSLNTKLQGQVIFGATGTIGGDYSRNTAFGHRSRLELKTDINGGTLTTRLQAVGLGLSNQNPKPGTAAVATPEGSLSWTDGTTTSSIGIDALKYEFPLSPQTQVVVAANAGASDDFTDTINPYFDGDGASGSISAFGNRPSIYYTVQGAGAGIRHKLGDTTELSLGYLARSGNDPALGNGLFGGGYGALAQLTFKTGENSKVGVTYTRTLNSDPGTGSLNANLGGISNNFGLQGSFQLTPEFALGGWAGYTQNQATGGDRQIWNWALTAAAPDFGAKGNLAGLLVGQEPRVTSSGDGTTDTKSGLHIEGFYQIKVSDNLSITPGIIYLTAPNQDANSSSAVIGAVRTTFSF
ncbi:iron uptake porin [Chamaesiphon sp. VAR_48_metabat_135_sub]|uniref:iron uptake porin n=1 Tax=Chamaesiphon sp. VAR_48_metabat_135_sub TaxID=2964699 RepID=UPI00286B1B0D|nr:iron uptake porin [Chamaesiphon sp. VAR_48_metabat_135_sub]